MRMSLTGRTAMPDPYFTVELQQRMLRRADGLIWGVHVFAPKVIDTLFVLRRADDTLHELRPYRVGMLGGWRCG